MPLYWTKEDKDAGRPIRYSEVAPIFPVLHRKGQEEIGRFKRALSHDVDWVQDQVRKISNNPGPYLLLGSTYLLQAGMIFGPTPPPVKALGVAWAAFPMADPFTLAVGHVIF